MRKFRRVAAVGALTAALTSATVVPAAADARAEAGPGGPHCVVKHDSSTDCFQTFREAIAHATGGRLTDVPNDPAAALASKTFERRINALSRIDAQAAVSSIEYQHPNYNSGGGKTLTFRLGRCGSDTSWDYRLSDIDNISTWWDDRISSYRGYNGCQVNHYEHPNWSGAQTGYHSNDGDMGAMEDVTSSLAWR